jgi:hypothetical protein
MKRLYSIEEAAAELAPVFTIDWLRKHMSDIPHTKSGKGSGRAGRVGFTEAHLAEILAKFEVRPEPKPEGASSLVTRRRAS